MIEFQELLICDIIVDIRLYDYNDKSDEVVVIVYMECDES